MDRKAISHATENELKELGLIEKGHIIAVKAFCKDKPNNQTSLLSYLKSAGKDRVGKSTAKGKRKKINVGWKHYNTSKKKYVSVREVSGGGIRQYEFPLNADSSDILTIMKKFFFPDGNNSYAGNIDSFKVSLGNNAGELIANSSNFNLQSYIKETGFHSKTRLYLLTSPKTSRDVLKEYRINSNIESSDSDSDDDFVLPKKVKFSSAISSDDDVVEIPSVSPIVSSNVVSSTPVTTREDDSVIELPSNTNTKSKNSSALIGTTAERQQIKTEVEAAYKASLEADEEKARSRQFEKDEEDRLQNLMSERASRVVKEPLLTDPHHYVKIRHPIIQSRTRLFPNGQFCMVYDWVGSLNPRPEHFEIKDYAGKIIQPHLEIQAGTYNVCQCDEPLLLSPEGTVAFKGYGVIDQSPNQTENTEVVLEEFEYLKGLCCEEQKRFNGGRNIKVSRDTIYEDIIESYRKRNTVTSSINITFNDEDAVGDGVTKDAFSEFYEQLYKRCEGVFAKLPNLTTDEDELDLIGKVITHGFVQLQVFPLGLAKASMMHFLGFEVEDSYLIESFLQYLPPGERQIIEAKDLTNVQALIDIFSDCGIFEQPKFSNIETLTLKAAKVVLIKRPHFVMETLVKGMGRFWKRVSKEMIESLYTCTMPTPLNVINSLAPDEKSAKDANITTWLHRFIRSCTQSELQRFIRFITGSELFFPGTIIKVNFINQSVDYLRPITRTCFKILYLPRQYANFYNLRDNFIFYMQNKTSWSVHDGEDEEVGEL